MGGTIAGVAMVKDRSVGISILELVPTATPTPTVVPTPTPTRRPTPIPTRLPTPTSTPLSSFGPRAGSLFHDPDTNTIKTHPALMTITDFVSEAEFFNPYSTSGNSWDYGFIFRRSPDGFDILIVYSSGRWEHRLRSGVGDQGDETIGSGYLSTYGSGAFDTSTRGSNRLKLVVVEDKGWLFVNSRYVGTLNLGSSVTAGDVNILTGYSSSDQVAGAVTRFEDFTVTPLSKRYGPVDGTLAKRAGFIAAQSSGLNVTDAVIEARFFNPSPLPDNWSYGFQIRDSGPNTFDAVFVNRSQGQFVGQQSKWHHYTRTGSVESSVLLDSSVLYDLSTGLRDSNNLLIIVLDDEGWLFVKGRFISKLNLGVFFKSGDIQAISGYFGSDSVDAVVRFEDFTVWSW